MIPIYRAKTIKQDYNEWEECEQLKKINGVWYAVGFYDDYIGGEVCYLHTLEISNSHKFRKLSECNFRTDYEMDMNSYNGYLDGWNNALKENGKPPHKVYEMIKANK